MQFKLITLNIEHGGKLFDNILEFVRDEKPDVLLLQEVYNSKDKSFERRFRTVEVLANEFFDILPHHDFRGIAYDPVIKAEMGNAIFSKFLISYAGSKFFDVPYGNVNFTGQHDPPSVPRAVQYATITIGDINLYLLNLHGIWADFGGDSQRRIDMGKDIAELLKGKKYAVLAGDTNFTKDATKTIQAIEGAGVKSVFGKSLQSTFNMAYKSNPAYATAAVDMVFVSDDIKIVKKEMPEADVSDHYPLKVILEI